MCLIYRMNKNNSLKRKNDTNATNAAAVTNHVNNAQTTTNSNSAKTTTNSNSAKTTTNSNYKGMLNIFGLGSNSATNNATKNVVANNSHTGGGVFAGAPVNYRYPANMQQPSEEVMEWATTANAPTPLSGMRNVAHGGRRRHTRRHKRKHTRKHKTHRHKRHHRRASHRRNR
jgi:hypothetical protein